MNATIEGVVREPSAFGMTCGSPPSMTATQEFVVPRSMPITLPIAPCPRAGKAGPGQPAAPSPLLSPPPPGGLETTTRAGRSSRSHSR